MNRKISILLSTIFSAGLIIAILVLVMSLDNLRKSKSEISMVEQNETEMMTTVEMIDNNEIPASDEWETLFEEPETEEAKTITMAFTGDIYLSEYVLNSYHQSGIGGVLSPFFLAEMQHSDITMVNQEFPFSRGGTPAPDKQYTFRLDPDYVKLFSEMGINLVTLANNHTLDYGEEALLDTLVTLEDEGIPYVGAGRNLDAAKALQKVELSGTTIGFLAASRVIPEVSWNATATKPGLLVTYDSTILGAEIEKAKTECDLVVVYVHWGIERDEYPHEEHQRKLGKEFIDAGADLVIGSHPHVLQGIEYYEGKPIIYSLGNFIFGSSIPKTIMLKAEYDGDQGLRLFALPGTSAGGYTKNLEGEEGQEILRYLESISFNAAIDENGEIREE